MKRLAVFMDGTWNAVDDNTNVWRFKSLCTPQGADGVEQLVYYEIGVNGIWGGMFRGMSAPPCATALGLSASITRAWIW